MEVEVVTLIQKWESTKKVVYRVTDGVGPSGHKLQTYWNLLVEKSEPNSNKFINILELWSASIQESMPLNERINKVYNLANLCDYPR